MKAAQYNKYGGPEVIEINSKESVTDAEIEEMAALLDKAILGYGEVYDQVIILVDEYKATGNNYLYGGIVGLVGALITIIFASRYSDSSEESRAKKLIFATIRNGFLFILVGFGVTWVTYSFMPGDSYYIFWGLAVYGVYAIGIAVYKLFAYRGKWAELLTVVDKKDQVVT